MELASNNMLRALFWSRAEKWSQLYVELAVLSAADAWHYGKVVLGYGPGPVSNQED